METFLGMQEQQMWSETDVMTMRVNELDAVMSALGVGTDRGQPSGLDDVLSLAAGERQRLGELLCAAERVTPTQREEVLAEQRRSGRKLGEILIDRSNLAASECEAVLEFHRRLAGQGPTAGKLFLGNLLVVTGQITRQQLVDALKHQSDHGGRLVVCGHATPHQITRGLSLQRKRIVAVLIAALALVSGPAVQNAQAEGNTAKFTVKARIATFFRMQVEHQTESLTVTASDIARGYVEVPAASNFSVITNTLDGFIIDFRPRGDLFRSALVTGLHGAVEIGNRGGTVLYNAPHGRTSFHQLGYRFMLRPDLQPGNYPWPLEISVRSA